ncbi:hypothetical protein [Nocardioides lianchengensis]|uniref:Uncharacterized protein n=1 Tax=Nocardioides lianchengensis TaxID=1045774 RepID=A0A1G6XWY3_9ACTN|nr:hypothetical protein [Nocardioides lianchengensis]NYG13471.1 hypothetical protein [Nocardioides lianchengensis]SDD82620.1 hypothetical protein SAMN05421872_111117 [Nocardioides lianchengensis]
MSLEKLGAEHVRATVVALERRIDARFPERGLHQVSLELVAMVDRVASVSVVNRRRIDTARTVSRTLMALVVVATVVVLVIAARDVSGDAGPDSSVDWVPLIESAINDLVFAAIAVFFLWSFPERVQRGQVLTLLHQLRSLAHIVDMHQLTKDPERLRPDFVRTPVSPEPHLDRDQLEHYLNYCSELLSLVGKAAALCAEESRDNVVLDTVSTIESLTTGMSRKIWQKISVLPKA